MVLQISIPNNVMDSFGPGLYLIDNKLGLCDKIIIAVNRIEFL